MALRAYKSFPNPCSSHSESIERFNSVREKLPIDQLYPPSLPKLYTHGYKTRRAILWLHGYTNSPHGFDQIAQACFDQGDNVYVPLAPYHGYRNRLTEDTALLTAHKLAEFADISLDIAQGLGEEVIIGGLSMGGVLTAWLSQMRHNIHRALIISPAFGAQTIPARLTWLMAIYLLIRPNRFRWWNKGDEFKDYTQPSPRSHSYPRISMHGLAHIFHLGSISWMAGTLHSPRADEVWWILNENDLSINNQLNYMIYENWRKKAPDRIHCYTFPASLKLGHDIIDPSSTTQRVEISHPMILSILNKEKPEEVGEKDHD